MKVPAKCVNSSGSPPLAEQQESDRQKLLSALLSSVKSCQTRFGGRSQLATESEPCVAALCAALEAVLWHGLRPKPANAPWRFIRETLTRHEAERFLLLRRVCTDCGRGRAWLRACLNECSLERGLSSLRAAPSLATHYYSWAFLRDEERASTLTTMAAGLGSVLFAINVDSVTLNEGDQDGFEGNAVILLGRSEPEIASCGDDSTGASKPQQLRRRRAPPHIVSFDDDSAMHPASTPSPPTFTASPPSASAPATCLNSPDTDCAAAALLATQQLLERQNIQLLAPSTPDKESEEGSGMASEDPVAALRTLLTQCMTLEAENRKLRGALRHEQAASSALLEELAEARQNNEQTLNQIQSRSQALSRENELLKHQLRKYVAAVQMLNRDGSSAHQTLASLAPAINQAVLEESRAQQQSEASQYEHKLIQVAEMHGELMEFNERLHRALYASETTAAQLRAELELLRGPLPSSRTPSVTDPLLEPDSPTSSVQSGALVHVWVPSAFLTGGTTDVHHVYQVYVRIRNDEWNVYRRYAQFHALHKELKRKHPAVRTYDFPPKKTIGNKDARFVEERRLRLQKYLRLVVNHIVQSGTQNGESPHRDKLIKLLPFFGETPSLGESSHQSGRSSSATRSSRPRASAPHYTGL
ncbi:hypothetical protein B566_EDAN010369 [Ephemera danica]|nr:hypothetical protein B566_EDAN010369 [Ephemera danica]